MKVQTAGTLELVPMAPPLPPQTFALLWYATMDRAAPCRQLVKRLLLGGSFIVVFGDSNSGKTFFLLDIAFHIAAGLAWRGLQVERGLVIWIAGEGATSARNRVAAVRNSHPEITGGLPFAIVPVAVNFMDPVAIDMLIATIRSAESECGEKAVLVVVDTLARAMPGGNENATEDMGQVVASGDRVRAETGAAVAFIHHSGKDSAKGARGSNSLRAATDTEILIEGQAGPRTARVTKQRDLESGGAYSFELTPVDIGRDDDGETITSCVVTSTDVVIKPKVTGRNQQQMLVALKEYCRANPAATNITSIAIRDMLKAQGLNRKRCPEVLESLVNIRVLTASIGGYTLDREMLP